MKNEKNILQLVKRYGVDIEKARKTAGWRENFVLDNFYKIKPFKANNRKAIELYTHETDSTATAIYDITNNLWC